MSLILDALNRARRDADPVSGVDSGQPPASPGGSPLFKYLPWVALALALMVIAGLLLRPPPRDSAPNAAAQLSRNVGDALTSVKGELRDRAAARETLPAPANPGAGAAGSVERQPDPQAEGSPPGPGRGVPDDAVPDPGAGTSAEETSLVQTSVEQKSVGDTSAEETFAQKAPAEKGPADEAAEEVAQLYREAAGPRPTPESDTPGTAPEPAADTGGSGARDSAPAAGEEPVDIEEILLRAKEEMRERDLVDHPAPFLIDLSQQTKDEIPTILYQQHDYTGDPSRSAVVLNGKTLRAGGTAAPGVTVDEILPDSVILSFRGTQFRLRALNSWVNL